MQRIIPPVQVLEGLGLRRSQIQSTAIIGRARVAECCLLDLQRGEESIGIDYSYDVNEKKIHKKG